MQKIGYSAVVLLVIRDIVTFHGETVDELEKAFKEAVDDYLATCEKPGVKPNKPYSGKLTLRIPPMFMLL